MIVKTPISPKISNQIIVFLLVFLAITQSIYGKESVRITVKSGARQIFRGFGCGQTIKNPGTYEDYTKIQQSLRDTLTSFIYKDCNFRFLEIWFIGKNWQTCSKYFGEYSDASNDYCIHNMQKIITSAYNDAHKQQKNLEVILQPNHYNNTSAKEWAEMTSTRIKVLQDDYGVPVNYLITAGEPGTDGLPASLQPEFVKEHRRALNKKGLNNVKIIGPDNVGSDSKAINFVKAIIDDQEALNTLYAFDTHSYNWSVSDEMVDIVKDHVLNGKKEYFQTEGGPADWLAEDEGNAEIASNVMAKVLADLNHLVSVWIFFRGISGVNTYWSERYKNSNGWNLAIASPGLNKFKIMLKTHYFKQLSRTIEPGAVCRRSIAHVGEVDKGLYWRKEDSTMVFAYGEKAPLYLAAAQNTDGSWGIALTNYTGFKPNQYSTPRPKKDYKVTINVEELRYYDKIDFNIYRSNAIKGNGKDDYIHQEGTVTMKNGILVVDSIGQYDMITLRSSTNIAGIQNAINKKKYLSNLSANYLSKLHKTVIVFNIKPGDDEITSPVELSIYTTSGKKIATLINKDLSAGQHKITWQGTTSQGKITPPGMYIIKLSNGVKSTYSPLVKY